MNATPSIFQVPLPSPGSSQTSSPAAADPADRSGGQDFANAMSAAGGKPVRKVAAKQHDSTPSGNALPVAGNQTPPPAAAAASTPPPAQAGTAAVSANSSPAGVASTTAAAAPSSVPVSDPANADAAVDDQAETAVIGATPQELTGADPDSTAADLGPLPPTPNGAIAGADPTPQHAAGILASSTIAPAQPATLAKTPSVATPPAVAAAPAPKMSSGATSKSDAAAATSAPTSSNGNATPNAQPQASTTGAADADAAAQVAMAAALAQGTSEPAPDSSGSSDDLATPDTGVTLQGAGAANDVASPLPGGLPLHGSAAPTSASVTAASAASIVPAVSASADSGSTDKHSRDNNPDGSVGAAQLLTSNAPSDAAASPSSTFKVSAGVDTADFGQGVADRVSLMVDSNLTNAKLQVNPPALGPIEVRIALQGGHAQVWMSSHSAVTRDALESTSPKLREMLNSQGFAQVSVDISQRSFQDRTPQPQPQAYESVSAIGSNAAATIHASAATARSTNSLLDAYA